MVDFASVFQNANHPSVQMENPMDAMGRAMQLQNMGTQGQLLQQQVQTGALQQTQLQRQIQDAQDVRDAIKSANGDTDQAMANVTKLGSQTSLQYLTHMQQMRKAGVELNTAQNDLATKHLTKVGNDIGGAQTPTQAANIIQAHAMQGNIPAAQAQELLGSIPQNPDEFKSWQTLQASKLGASKELLGLLTPKSKVEGAANITTDPLTGKVTGVQPIAGIPQSEVAKELADYNATSGKAAVGINDPAFTAWHQKMHPNAAMMMMGTSGGPAAPGQFAPDALRPWRDSPSFQKVASTNSTLASDVDSALNNDYKFGGSRGIQYDRQVQHAAQQVDPNWRQGSYDLKQDALKDKQVVASNAAVILLSQSR